MEVRKKWVTEEMINKMKEGKNKVEKCENRRKIRGRILSFFRFEEVKA